MPKEIKGKQIIFSGDLLEWDSTFQEGILPETVLKHVEYNPTPEQYQKGLEAHRKICETKTHQKGFAFWNQYKKSH